MQNLRMRSVGDVETMKRDMDDMRQSQVEVGLCKDMCVYVWIVPSLVLCMQCVYIYLRTYVILFACILSCINHLNVCKHCCCTCVHVPS